MKYFLIAGEASGDMHGAGLMRELKLRDPNAEFWFLGGDEMCAVGGVLVRHYRDMAFMGFVSVLLNLHKVLRNFYLAKKALRYVIPDVVILIDYPSFNMKIASFVVNKLHVPVYYYIAPKVWAWKTYRVKQLKREMSGILTIFPFETEFFAQYGVEVHYVGNPSVDAIEHFKINDRRTGTSFRQQYQLNESPYIALLPGSRKQEIESCLPAMLEAASRIENHSVLIAGAPGIAPEFYSSILATTCPGLNYSLSADVQLCDTSQGSLSANIEADSDVGNNTQSQNSSFVKVITGETYQLLLNASVAVVNSGTATLETALLNIPQVVVYALKGGKFTYWLKDKFIKTRYISLVNILMNKEVVRELIAHLMTPDEITLELRRLLFSTEDSNQQLNEYDQLRLQLGKPGTAARAADVLFSALQQDNAGVLKQNSKNQSAVGNKKV